MRSTDVLRYARNEPLPFAYGYGLIYMEQLSGMNPKP